MSAVLGLPLELWHVTPSWRGSTEALARERRAVSAAAMVRAVLGLVYICREALGEIVEGGMVETVTYVSRLAAVVLIRLVSRVRGWISSE